MHIKGALRSFVAMWCDRNHTLSPEDERLIAEYAEQLPEPDRTIFILRRQRGLPTDQIGRHLNMQRDVVRESLQRSYAGLRVSVFPPDDPADTSAPQ